jgi:hypothetical protein
MFTCIISFESLLVEQRKTRALLSMLQADESSNSVDELAVRILDIAADAVQSQMIAVCFVDKQSGDLMCVAGSSIGTPGQTGSDTLNDRTSTSPLVDILT